MVFKKASGDMTVSQWKQNRFYPYYPGLEVDVLDVVGIAVSEDRQSLKM